MQNKTTANNINNRKCQLMSRDEDRESDTGHMTSMSLPVLIYSFKVDSLSFHVQLLKPLTCDHSMATHWGQAKVLQICRATGRGECVHFHSSTWENCPWASSSTHSTLRSCQPPFSPQDTEHWVQGPCSQLCTHRRG